MLKRFELVVPAYNESKSLPTLIAKTIDAAQAAGLTSQDFQLVLVDNGSNDGTQACLRDKIGEESRAWFRVVTLKENRGYGGGLAAGLRTTTAPVIGYTHADLQCDPKDAFKALKLCEDAGPKSFTRSRRHGRLWKDRLVSRIFSSTARCVLNLKIDEINAQPKVFSSSLLSELKSAPTDFAFDIYVLYTAARLNYRFNVLAVSFPPRVYGVSKWSSNLASRYTTFGKMLRFMLVLRGSQGRL